MRILSLVRSTRAPQQQQQQRHLITLPPAASTAVYLFVGSSISSIQTAYSFDFSSLLSTTLTYPPLRTPWQTHQQQQQRFFFTAAPFLKMSTSAVSDNNINAENDDKAAIQKTRSDSICSHGSGSSSSSSSKRSVSDDDHLRIQLPCREYGYRTVPLDWEELTLIINVEQNLAKLSRSVQQQYDYEIYQRDLKNKWQSVMDHILCSKFGGCFQQVTNPETGLYCAHPSLADFTATGDGVVRKALVRNDFPYYLADNVEHWVLWKLGANCTDQDVEQAKQAIRERQINVQDFLYYINPPHLKSLPEIDHVHILCKTTISSPTATEASPITKTH
jgi:Protein of unknown function (DUF3605)